MQLHAEMPEVQRGVPAAVARVGERQCHVVAEKRRALDVPVVAGAAQRDQSLRVDTSSRSDISTSGQGLQDVDLGVAAQRRTSCVLSRSATPSMKIAT